MHDDNYLYAYDETTPDPYDDDLYWVNQREADDYRDEGREAFDPDDEDDYYTESAFGYEEDE